MPEDCVSEERLKQALKDAGCGDELLARFSQLGQCGCKSEQLCLLGKYRTELLDAMHLTQQQLECLDYVIYQLKGPARCDCCCRKNRTRQEKE